MPHTSDHADMGDDITQQSGHMPQSPRDDARRYAGGMGDIAPDTGGTRAAVKEASDTAKEKAQEYGQKAQEQADAGIDRAAEGMQSTADTIREKAHERGGKTAEYGTKAADAMEKGAQYLREHDSEQIVSDVEEYVKTHPVQAVAGALVGGFIIGRLLG